jgi:DNA-binding CsgD family transcriptional regulator
MALPKLQTPKQWIDFTPEQRSRFCVLYNAGARYVDISAELGISCGKVGLLRDFLKLPRRLNRVAVPVQKVLYSYATLGMTATEIAKRLNVSRKSITRILKEKGVEVRPNKPVKKCSERRAEIYRRVESGERMVDVAASLRLSTKTIRRRILEVIRSQA